MYNETLDQVYVTTQSGDTFLVEISEGISRRFTKISIPQINFEHQLEKDSLIELSEILLNLFDNMEQQ